MLKYSLTVKTLYNIVKRIEARKQKEEV